MMLEAFEALKVNPHTHQVKLCDFGSAKVLVKREPNISYICSRYYRAPELIFGATEYTAMIDIWSGGCVLAELMLGQGSAAFTGFVIAAVPTLCAYLHVFENLSSKLKK
ncbi:hypothetical protein L2E82_06202 [Cichorium intybus]|uniref:Uncharacterized protein n=1 Tax=Cichorium intybus TaxID=13427 RepID=A0ACB9HBK7_CICIN|nr:hypothetical protein L2E82_06202 [Cichorium intybus]